jgi:hypothetical protein
MGGPGSGPRWWRGNKKATVEDSHVLTAQALVPFLGMETWKVGTMTWTRGEEKEVVASISYRRVEVEDPARRVFRFIYTVGKGEAAREADYVIQLVSVSPHFGGVRWFFLCPLVYHGTPCLHRGDKLYLPPGGLYFGCRKCYDLTYTTSQESHKFDGMYKSLAAGMGRGITPQEVKYLLWRQKRNL